MFLSVFKAWDRETYVFIYAFVVNGYQPGHKTHWFSDLGPEHLLDSKKYGKSDLMPPSVSVPLIYFTILCCSKMSSK